MLGLGITSTHTKTSQPQKQQPTEFLAFFLALNSRRCSSALAFLGNVGVGDLINQANEKDYCHMRIYTDWKSLVLAIIGASPETTFTCAAQSLVDAGELLAQSLEKKVILELAPEDQRKEVVLPALVLGKIPDNAYYDGVQMVGSIGGVFLGGAKPGFAYLPPVMDYVGDEPGGPELPPAIMDRFDFKFLFPNYPRPYQMTFGSGNPPDILPADIIAHEVPHGLPDGYPRHQNVFWDLDGRTIYGADSIVSLLLSELDLPGNYHKPTDVIYTTERGLHDAVYQFDADGVGTFVCASQALVTKGQHLAQVWGKTALKFELVTDPKQRIPEPPTYADIRERTED